MVELNYELSNHGNANSTGFWANLYLSDDEELDTTTDPLVWRRYMEPDAITGFSGTGLISTSVQHPRCSLRSCPERSHCIGVRHDQHQCRLAVPTGGI